jgi:hypothetical protein
LRGLARRDSQYSRAEVAAALVKASRTKVVPHHEVETALRAFGDEWTALARLHMTEVLVARAATVAWDHSLRGYDAVHLATAPCSGRTWWLSVSRSQRSITNSGKPRTFRRSAPGPTRWCRRCRRGEPFAAEPSVRSALAVAEGATSWLKRARTPLSTGSCSREKVSQDRAPVSTERRLPVVLLFLLIEIFVWFAENISTLLSAWQ